ncbi:Swi5-domain-containing protein [Lipomyces mesembrius]
MVKSQIGVAHQELRTGECDPESSLDLVIQHGDDGDGLQDQVENGIDDGLMEPAMIDDNLEVHCEITQGSADEYEYDSEFGSEYSERNDQAEENARASVNEIIFDSTISTEVDTVAVERTSSAHQDMEQQPSTPSPQDASNQTAFDLAKGSAEVSTTDSRYIDSPTPDNEAYVAAIQGQNFAITNDAFDSNLSHLKEDYVALDPNGRACVHRDGGPVRYEVEVVTVETSQYIENNCREQNQTSPRDWEVARNSHSVMPSYPLGPHIAVTAEGNERTGPSVPLPPELMDQSRDPYNCEPVAQPPSNTVRQETPIDAPPTKSPLDFITAKETKEASIKARIQEKQARLADLQKEYDDYIKKLKSSDPAQTIKRHIKLLKEYNEIRDVGLGLIGMIADTRGVRVADVMPEYGVSVGD